MVILHMTDRIWRRLDRRRTVRVEGWLDCECNRVFVVLGRHSQSDIVNHLSATVLHEVIHAASSRACEEHVANAEQAMIEWVGW